MLELGEISQATRILKIELKAGIIEVQIDRSSESPRISMRQLPPKFLRSYEAVEIMPLFGLSEMDLIPGQSIQTVSTGTPMLMIPLRDVSSLDKIEFNASSFAKYRENTDFFSAHLFAVDLQNGTIARHFCPPPDVLEDPFTGSATGAMACYLWKYGLIEKPDFVARQGMHLQRPGEGLVKILGDRHTISGVEVSGHAVTCLHGELTI